MKLKEEMDTKFHISDHDSGVKERMPRVMISSKIFSYDS